MANYPYQTYYTQPNTMQTQQNFNSWQNQNTQAAQQVQQTAYPQIGQTQYPVQQMLPGRIIQQESEIVAREVPNDGSFAVFVQQDLQRIYAKAWGGDGLIHTNVYERINDGQEKEPDTMTMILQRLDNIEKKLNESRSYQNRPKKPYRKPVRNNDEPAQEG